MEQRIETRKKTQHDVAENSKKCFKQIFKFTNGMTCLACDANYKSFITNENGVNYVDISTENCDNLKK